MPPLLERATVKQHRGGAPLPAPLQGWREVIASPALRAHLLEGRAPVGRRVVLSAAGLNDRLVRYAAIGLSRIAVHQTAGPTRVLLIAVVTRPSAALGGSARLADMGAVVQGWCSFQHARRIRAGGIVVSTAGADCCAGPALRGRGPRIARLPACGFPARLLEALIVVVRAASKPGALLVQAGTAVPEPKGLAAPGAVAHLAQLGWLALLHAGPEGGVLGITFEVKVLCKLLHQ